MAFTFKDGKLTKVDEKERQAAYSPSSPQSQAVRSGGGGKGSGKNMEFKDGSPSDDQRKRILASQNDKSYGYFDMNTGNYVPWYIDIQDGGGKNTSGDTFQGAGLYSAALNLANVAPYGYNRPRTYAQAGMENRPSGVSAADIEFMNNTVANNEMRNPLQQNVQVNELPPLDPSDANRARFDRTRSFPNVNSPLSSSPLNNQQIEEMVNPIIQGLLQQELRPEMVDPMQMMAMLRDQEMRRRNKPPTLLS
jgi:hypothetical protein